MYSHIILLGLYICIVCMAIDFLIFGVFFKKYQELIPIIWRKEKLSSFLTGAISTIIFGFLFAFFYAEIVIHFAEGKILFAFLFGLISWMVFYLPSLIANGALIRLNKMVVVSISVSTFLKVTSASILAAIIF